MVKKRVYEYAQEHNVPSKVVLEKANKIGLNLQSHMSTMENGDVTKMDEMMKKQSENKSPQNKDNQSAQKQTVDPVKKQNHKSTSTQEKSASKPVAKPKTTDSRTASQKSAVTSKAPAKTNQTITSKSTGEKKTTTDQKPASSSTKSTPQRTTAGGGGFNKNKGRNNPYKKNTRGKKGKYNSKPKPPVPQRKFRELPETFIYTEGMNVQDVAKKLHREPAEIIKKLFLMGVVATQNQPLPADALELIAADYGIGAEEKVDVDISDLNVYFETEKEDEDELVSRPPVVTIMGHVDHGKTTLLDSLRDAKVSMSEAGGITQHIGAYQIETEGKTITFLDTPGHAAFTTMRARGADVTDITIIVVAADDGVMPQTVEAINHAKAADVPIIVAVNKIDKPSANPDRVMQELTEHGLIPEAWGGDTIFVNISAKFGEGLDELLEMILLVSEVQELKANPNRLAIGTVIEARLDKSKGPIATLLVQEGILHIGDPIVVGNTHGRVRAMVNDQGRRVKKANPSMPVEITGLNDTPQAGDRFVVFEDEKTARQVGDDRTKQAQIESRSSQNRITLDNLFSSLEEGELKEVGIIVKGDVQGSVEALVGSFNKIEVEGVRIRIIHSAVGAINESDITLAAASNAIVIGFNVRATPQAKIQAEQEKVDIRQHRVIYNAIDEIETAMKGMLDPEYEEKVTGQALIRETFVVSKVGTIGGAFVTDGVIKRSSGVRVIRDNIVIHDGKLASLKRFKDDAKEVKNGFECGLMIEDYNDIQMDDVIEAYEMVEMKR